MKIYNTYWGERGPKTEADMNSNVGGLGNGTL